MSEKLPNKEQKPIDKEEFIKLAAKVRETLKEQQEYIDQDVKRHEDTVSTRIFIGT